MSTTPNLAIPHMAATDTNKYLEINNAISAFDGAYFGNVVLVDDPSLGFTTFSTMFLDNMVFIFTGALSADIFLTLPAHARPFIVMNQTTGGHSITFEIGSGTTVTISDSSPHFLYSDGAANIYAIS